MTRTVLVTGACGFIGSHLIHLLRAERPEWRVVSYDSLSYAGDYANIADLQGDSAHRFVMADICNPDAVGQVFEEERPDFVMHLAAESHVDRSILDSSQFLLTNVVGTQILLDAARTHHVDRFLYVSTDEVYGDVGNQGEARNEASPFAPSSPYAASKAAADLLTQSFARTYGLPSLICRPANHYGPKQFPEKLIPFMLRKLLRGEQLPIYGDGRQQRDWLFVEDGARALLAVLEHGIPGQAYNVAAHQGRPNLEVVDTLCRLIARWAGLPPEDLLTLRTFVPDRPGHDVCYALNDDRLREQTGWMPTVAFADGLAHTVDWYLSNLQWLDVSADRLSPAYMRSVYESRWDFAASGARG